MTQFYKPQADGLYDPRYEHDACGVAMVARLDNRPDHQVVVKALTALDNLEHRGAEGADVRTGDGAGILTQIPDAFFREVVDFDLPARGRYGVGMCFLPQDEGRRRKLEELIELNARVEGQRVLGWRDVPVDSEHVGETADRTRPYMRQVFIGAGPGFEHSQDAFERKLYVIRRVVELAAGPDFYAPSFSSRTCVYKGMLISYQLRGFYPDLADERFASALALVHSRFATNTFPAWDLAHPYRVIAHNGEINTLMGNINWMRARESQLASELFGLDLQKVMPIVRPGGSDSATFDNVLELLMLAGRSLPHAVMMMIPEAYADRDDIPEHLKGFYAYHSCLMEPWDGPAAVCFTNGTVVGATLDRNGLRPGRWTETKDGFIFLGSETGMLPVDPADVKRLGRLAPGKLFLIDLEAGRIVADEEVKKQVATQRPYGQWHRENVVHFDDLPRRDARGLGQPLEDLQRAFGYSQEDLRVMMAPLAKQAEEPVGSMGNDLALAVLSDQRPPLFSYFKQLFAQVTNPPIDPIRESIVMSLATGVGAEGNLLEESPEHARQLVMDHPILRNHQLERLRDVDHPWFRAHTIDITWPADAGPLGMQARLADACDEAHDAIQAGINILILSDRAMGPDRCAIPSLLAVGAVHHHLVRLGTRLRAGLVIESGEPREVHHFATLIGYGASAVNPYLMFESLDALVADGRVPGVDDRAEAQRRTAKGLGKGLLKTISKMGISTIQSYCGAQIFEAVGLDRSVVDRHFTGTASRVGGIRIDVIAQEALDRHARAYGLRGPESVDGVLPVGGVYAWRRDGEHHMWNPETIAQLQHAVRSGNGDAQDRYRDYAREINESASRKATLRGLLKIRTDREPIGLDEVEPAKEIVRRFATGAMSLGSISTEAHETLAIAMNRLGGRSNTGEGGEDPRRFKPDANGDLRRSAIKQVASGRFGVTVHYLVNADQIQIKMAQGAKPGEGGQLPGHKVDRYIGSVRHTTPGVGLISPPPHHDIYSIEDLKQLIYDLRCANPSAQVSVKLVAEIGVGTVAAGVAKANADHVVIAGHDGGTGASPLSSIFSAGVPWEIGLAETQQTLLKNDLRTRIVVQTDGQLKTGRDVAIAAMLGADEMGFSTAPLIATGCIMMRACHLNTCPVGIATQDPELRKRFEGKPEHVVNFFFFVAEEVREIMASLGVRKFEELIGRVDMLEADAAIDHWKARGVDLTHLLAFPSDVDPEVPRRRLQPPPAVLADHLDHQLLERCGAAIEHDEPVEIDTPVRNVNRCVGGMLSSKIAELRGAEGLPEDTIKVTFHGSAGQSFGGWLAPGVSFHLYGDANDYTGKGLSGGILSVQPPETVTFAAEENQLIGNTVLYGATNGKAFFRGRAGERFAVRNSGASAVIEGVGDHGCEYMTGGRVVVLGPTGRNFAAGMSGGVAYVLDEDSMLRSRVNPAMLDQLEELDEADLMECRSLVEEHLARTGSTVAQRVLSRWDDARRSFVKVFPADYKRVLAELEAERFAGDAESTGGEGFVIEETEVPMGEIGAFLKIERVGVPYRDPQERVGDFGEFLVRRPDEELAAQGARCMECGVPFCHNGCPLGNLIPDWNDLVYRDRWADAIRQLHATNNFPEFTGRLCPAPCEAACVLEIREGDAVTIKQIENSIIDRAWEEGWVVAAPPAVETGRSVAVVGAGPAGMAAAQQLRRAGHAVVLFERDEAAGGLVRFGVPDFKIDKRVVERRVGQLRDEGIELRCGVDVGVDVTVDELRSEFDAVVLATGSRVPRDLPVPGRELDGVHFAMDYLYVRNRAVAAAQANGGEVATGEITAAGKHVIVIGGGDTGADCVANSVREGAASVTQLELLPEPPQSRPDDRTPWPLWPAKFRLSYAMEEARALGKGEQDFSVVTTHFSGDGRVEKLHYAQAAPAPPFGPVEGTEGEMQADLVLLAMGFLHPEPGLLDALGVAKDPRGNAKAGTYETSEPGVFAAGDCRRGQSLIVWAINEGRQAARMCDRHLRSLDAPAAAPAGDAAAPAPA